MIKRKFSHLIVATALFSGSALAIEFSDMEEVFDKTLIPKFDRNGITDFEVSEEGRFVSFFFEADNLSPPFDRYKRLFVVDRFSSEIAEFDNDILNGFKGGMTSNGRYIYNGNKIFDLKTGDLVTVAGTLNENAISDNGRYAAISTNQDPLSLGVNCTETYALDLATGTLSFESASFGTTSTPVCQASSGVFSMSGDGTQIYWDSDSSDDQALRYGPYPNDFDRAIYTKSWSVAADVTQRISARDGETEEESNVGGDSFYDPSFSKDGMHVAVRAYRNLIDNQANGAHIFVRDIATLNIEPISVDQNGDLVLTNSCDDPSMSNDARYVTFFCDTGLTPETTRGIYVRDRVTQTTHFIADARIAKISGDGQYILLRNGGNFNLNMDPNSDDGLYIVGNPAARNPQDRPTYQSNYMYVSVPNSENNWIAYDYLTLVDNQLWKGIVTFDGLNGDAFKLDIGGYWVNGDIQFEGPWQNNFGDNGFDTYLDAGGADIAVTQGEGVYEITFNESAMQYSIVKLTEYPTIFIRGTNNNWGVTKMAYAGSNTWEAVVTFNGANDERFKFDVYGDWSKNLGDDNADGVLDLNGADISMSNANGKYLVRFFQDTLNYSVTPF